MIREREARISRRIIQRGAILNAKKENSRDGEKVVSRSRR